MILELMLIASLFAENENNNRNYELNDYQEKTFALCMIGASPRACYQYAIFLKWGNRDISKTLLALNSGCYVSTADFAQLSEIERKSSAYCCRERARLILNSNMLKPTDARNSFWAACYNPLNVGDNLNGACFEWGAAFEEKADSEAELIPSDASYKNIKYFMLEYSLQGFLAAYNDRGVKNACARALVVKNKILQSCEIDDKPVKSVCDWANTVALPCSGASPMAAASCKRRDRKCPKDSQSWSVTVDGQPLVDLIVDPYGNYSIRYDGNFARQLLEQ